MLPPLLRKAAGDAGFDLQLGQHAEWERLGVSGVNSKVWVVPVETGAILALEPSLGHGEFETVSWTDVPLPAGAGRAVRCSSPAELYEALRRVRVLLNQKPPLPEERFKERLRQVTTTETDAVVKQRVGQDLFREMLMEYWDGRCAVTGLAVPELLRASHAKPWKDSTDAERLDVYNGFLLTVHLDALFDKGLMTFQDDGSALFSDRLTPESRTVLALPSVAYRLSRTAEGHRPYLAHHRAHVFNSDSESGT